MNTHHPTMITYNIFLGLVTRTGVNLNQLLGTDSVLATVTALLQGHGHDGATITEATGMWKGQTEPSYVILIEYPSDEPGTIGDAERVAFNKVSELCQDLCVTFNQEAVAIQRANPLVFIGSGAPERQ